MAASELPSNSSESIDNSSMPPEAAVLDQAAALKRLGGDRSIFIELAKMFSEDAPGLLEAIRQGIHEGRYVDAGRAAHSLRGLAANFDGARLMFRLRELEAVLAKGERERSLAVMDGVRQEERRLQGALQTCCQ
jgi:HPt (histidine-containing phosphotransfer) domain-containing protein